MPFIDEREEAREILKRYNKLESSKIGYWTLLFFLLIPMHTIWGKSSYDWYILMGMLLLWLRSQYITRATRREFLAQMTSAELDLLARTSTVGFNDSDKRAAKGLLKAYHKIYPEKEYLRASTEPQDDTLLRAAQYTNEKAQEQLLRPTDEKPI